LGFPFNIATAEASDFKFCMQLRLANAHHKITRRRKSGRGRGLRELPKIWRFPFNIYAITESSDFKFIIQRGFSKAHHKIAHRAKSVRNLWLGKLPDLGFPVMYLQQLKLAISNLAYSLGLLIRPITKSHK